MYLTGGVLILVTFAGSLGSLVALDGYHYSLLVAAIVFESGFAALHVFCGGRLGRGYDPLHPSIRAQMPRLLVLHLSVVALLVAGGVLLVQLKALLGPRWVVETGPKHQSPLSTVGLLLLAGVTVGEALIARRWLRRVVSPQSATS